MCYGTGRRPIRPGSRPRPIACNQLHGSGCWHLRVILHDPNGVSPESRWSRQRRSDDSIDSDAIEHHAVDRQHRRHPGNARRTMTPVPRTAGFAVGRFRIPTTTTSVIWSERSTWASKVVGGAGRRQRPDRVTTTTDSLGNYSFTGLAAGTHGDLHRSERRGSPASRWSTTTSVRTTASTRR